MTPIRRTGDLHLYRTVIKIPTPNPRSPQLLEHVRAFHRGPSVIVHAQEPSSSLPRVQLVFSTTPREAGPDFYDNSTQRHHCLHEGICGSHRPRVGRIPRAEATPGRDQLLAPLVEPGLQKDRPGRPVPVQDPLPAQSNRGRCRVQPFHAGPALRSVGGLRRGERQRQLGRAARGPQSVPCEGGEPRHPRR